MEQSLSQKGSPNVITVRFSYGQLVPVKVLTWHEAIPNIVCTRWGGIFQRNAQEFYEPVDENSLTTQEREENVSLLNASWVLPSEPRTKSYRPNQRIHISNKVEELSDLFARYHNK